jgi:2-polyprenyl-3-methyl-5-hydroxy-6-metoxy-1,4-benzoquinol methylase
MSNQKYNTQLDPNATDSTGNVLRCIKPNTSVIEFAPAWGKLTKYLHQELHCDVSIVEIDEESGKNADQYSFYSLIGKEDGDIEKFKWYEELKFIRYDYILFLDVLEHLYNPAQVLLKSKDLLQDDGSIFISIPNITHNSIIMKMFQNNFTYSELGLLDNTHIRFFGYNDLIKMITDCGLQIVQELNTYNIPENTEFKISYNEFLPEISKFLKERKFGEVYQFVFELKKC